MKVSTTGFLLASLYGSAWAAPVSGDLAGGNAAPGNIAPVNDLTKSLTGAVGQSDSIVGRDAPIGGALEPVTSTGGLGNVAGANAAPVNDLTKSLTGAVGQPGSIVGRDGEQKASVVLPEHTFVATGHTADVDIRADATNVHARNFDAKFKGVVGQLENDAHTKFHPFHNAPVDINANVMAVAANHDSAKAADSV